MAKYLGKLTKANMKNTIQKALAVSLILPAIFLSACQPSPAANPSTTTSTTTGSTTTTLSGASSTTSGSSTTTSITQPATNPVTKPSMQTEAPKKGDTIATIETDKGTIKLKLFPDAAPETVKNFIELAKAGKYNNVPFHRVIQGFMIQTGDFTNKNGTGGYSYKGPGTHINDEFSTDFTNFKGTVSMANAGPDTNGSQFFIVTADGDVSYLNNHYSVFGQVYEGQAVADEISKVKTGPSDNPLTPIIMKTVTISTL